MTRRDVLIVCLTPSWRYSNENFFKMLDLFRPRPSGWISLKISPSSIWFTTEIGLGYFLKNAQRIFRTCNCNPGTIGSEIHPSQVFCLEWESCTFILVIISVVKDFGMLTLADVQKPHYTDTTSGKPPVSQMSCSEEYMMWAASRDPKTTAPLSSRKETLVAPICCTWGQAENQRSHFWLVSLILTSIQPSFFSFYWWWRSSLSFHLRLPQGRD